MPKHGTLIRTALVLVAAAAVAAMVATGASAKRSGTTLVGAGSSLVAPAFSIWAPAYQSAKGVTVNYSSVGSGAGIAQISARTVDFGASDAPFSTAQAQGCVVNGVGCVNIPWALAATGPVVNIPGVKTLQLKLTGPVLAKIYLGQITNWNDPAITALNSGLNLPNMAIHVVYRSDGSGDTYAFTNYLSKVSKAWSSQVGFATTVNWPTGTGGHGNNGVAAVVESTSGSIGYVSTAYTIANHLRIVKLKNASGNYAAPTVKAIESAASLVNSRKIPKNFVGGLSIVDPPKTKTHKYTNAWPISTFTYVLVPLKTPQASQLKSLIKWVLQPAQQKSIQHLVFAPMPQVVVKAADKMLSKITS